MRFALLTRVYEGELPYINEFIEYHLKLGITEFHLIHTDNSALVDSIDNRYLPKCLIHERTSRSRYEIQATMVNMHKCIEADYILNLDCDEFLFLDGKTLEELVQLYPNIHNFQFNWLICIARALTTNSVLDILRTEPCIWGKEIKSLSKNSNIDTIRDHWFVYNPNFKARTVRFFESQIFHYETSDKANNGTWGEHNPFEAEYNPHLFCVFHFLSRGFIDTFIRVLTSKLKPTERREIKHVLSAPSYDWNKLPKRLRVLKLVYMLNDAKPHVNLNLDRLPTLSSKNDNILLSNLLHRNLRNTKEQLFWKWPFYGRYKGTDEEDDLPIIRRKFLDLKLKNPQKVLNQYEQRNINLAISTKM